MTVAGLWTLRAVPWTPFLVEGQSLGAGLGLGLAVVMWNYGAGTRRRRRSARRASPSARSPRPCVWPCRWSSPPTCCRWASRSASAGSDWRTWATGSLPRIAAGVGGPWLGHAVAAGAVLSAAGLFLALVLTNSRLPFVLARDISCRARSPGSTRSSARRGSRWSSPSAIYARVRRVLVQGADRAERVALLARASWSSWRRSSGCASRSPACRARGVSPPAPRAHRRHAAAGAAGGPRDGHRRTGPTPWPA